MMQQNQSNINEEIKPWYKQGWPWAIISIPILTVIAGVTTYFIAANQPHSMVKDDYFKEGMAINRSIEKQNKAISLNIVGNIFLDKESDLLKLQVTSNTKLSSKLEILFSHPTQDSNDRLVKLESISGNEYIGQLPELSPAHWYIRLNDAENTWIVKSRWHVQDSDRHILSASKE